MSPQTSENDFLRWLCAKAVYEKTPRATDLAFKEAIRMFDKIIHLLEPIQRFVFGLIDFMNAHQFLLAVIAGLLAPVMFMLRNERMDEVPFWKRMLMLLSFISFAFGTLAPIALWLLSKFYWQNGLFESPLLSLGISMVITAISALISVWLWRLLAPELDAFKRDLVVKTKKERDKFTDVRNVKDLLPSTVKYNPADYIDLDKGLFVGLGVNGEPNYIPMAEWQSQHADIIGTTGAGKGVASGLLLTQSIMAGEGVFVLDPKDDEWAPHLYKKACEDAGKPFVLINLNDPSYQMNLIEGIDRKTLKELFIAGFSLGAQGEGADFYRLFDRIAARTISSLAKSGEEITLKDIFTSEYIQSIGEKDGGYAFRTMLAELCEVNAVTAKGGFSLKEIFDNGGCCYVIGNMRDEEILVAQRMILVRLIQIAEKRDRIHSKPRPIAIFLDEVKYHLSQPALEGLGAARDKGVHIIMAHQSLADLRSGKGLVGEAVVGAVVENCKFKLFYKVMCPITAQWAAEMTGTILVDVETRKVNTNPVLTEVISDERMISEGKRELIDKNMFLSLPPFVSYIFTAKTLPFASAIQPLVVKKEELIVHQLSPEKLAMQNECVSGYTLSDIPDLTPQHPETDTYNNTTDKHSSSEEMTIINPPVADNLNDVQRAFGIEDAPEIHLTNEQSHMINLEEFKF